MKRSERTNTELYKEMIDILEGLKLHTECEIKRLKRLRQEKLNMLVSL